jgi:peptidoglycan/LPS O-acetylase OafA/YrhL
MAERQSHTFATLDMLRGIATFAVLIGHCRDWFTPFVNGLLAVDLFFVMSGFVIAHAYEGKFGAGLSRMRFFVLRMIRLYPHYLAGTIMGIVVLATHGGDALPKLLKISFFSALMQPTPGQSLDLLYPSNPLPWSLLFEICINALYALTWRRWTTGALAAACAIALALLIASRIHLHGFDNGWGWWNFVGGLARVCYGFPLGVLI